MTVISAQFAVTDIKPDMVLSDDLLDPQGQVLLPKGATLTTRTIELLQRHGVASLRIVTGVLSPEEEAKQRDHFAERLNNLFRRSNNEHANGLLQRYIRTFRLGEEA